MNISLRGVHETDQPFLFELYASTREAELSQVPWTDAQKQSFLQMQFTAQNNGYRNTHPQATHEIICVDERPAGRLYLDRNPDHFHILDITVAPALRNAAIGSTVLKRILADAGRDRKAVSIYVETFNPSLRLFERLGFQTESVDGFQLLLVRRL